MPLDGHSEGFVHTKDWTQWQDKHLQGVSRTFALTIPMLPGTLRIAVANAYLFCRIIDTIEDDAALTADQKRHHAELFLACISGKESPESFATKFSRELSPSTPESEKHLVHETPNLLKIHHQLPDSYTQPVERCVRIMSDGMLEFQEFETAQGLPDLLHLNRYCYHVAGVVGEMLSDLYQVYCPALKHRGSTFHQQAVAFGQGLQMTNILKDVHTDRLREACWLPMDRLRAHGCDQKNAAPANHINPCYAAAMRELVGIAHGHLKHAFDYTLSIPSQEKGIRNFCLQALAMALINLRKIYHHPCYGQASEVKLSRRSVKTIITTCRLSASQDELLRFLYHATCRNLPHVEVQLPVTR